MSKYEIVIPLEWDNRNLLSQEWKTADAVFQIVKKKVERIGKEKLEAIHEGLTLGQMYRRDSCEAAEIERARHVMRTDYFSDVHRIGDDFMEEAKAGRFSTEDDAYTWLHETIDGCGRVIYTHKAMECLLYSEHSDAYAESCGEEGMVTDGVINWSALAYYALEADVRRYLEAHDIDPGNPETWAPAEEESEA